MTMALAGLCACLESDFKKIVAMSTLSQLGIMVYVLSMGSWCLSFFHMVTHAFFKRTLFLGRGSLIHQVGGGQDSRFYGGYLFDRLTGIMFAVRCISLAGFPFVVGFYSKDFILSDLSGNRRV